MKRIIFVLLFMGLLAGCDFDMARYTNREYGFSVLLPKSWQRSDGELGTLVLARESLQGIGDRFQANINIVVKDLMQSVSHRVFFELNRDKIQEIVPGIKYNMEDRELNSPKSGRGLCFVFGNKIENLDVKVTTCSWMKDNRVYVITCTCEADKAATYDSIFQKVLSSLIINK